MRALEIGTGEGLGAVNVVERPEPTPGHGEVLLRMRAVSLRCRDLITALTSAGRQPPVTPFSDGCGVVQAVGEGVGRVKVGDRVATLFFERWNSGRPTPLSQMSALGGGGRAAGAEWVVLNQDGVSKVPDFLTDHQVATLPCAALTAWRALFVDADLEPGGHRSGRSGRAGLSSGRTSRRPGCRGCGPRPRPCLRPRASARRPRPAPSTRHGWPAWRAGRRCTKGRSAARSCRP